MEDGNTLQDYSIQKDSTIHLVMKTQNLEEFNIADGDIIISKNTDDEDLLNISYGSKEKIISKDINILIKGDGTTVTVKEGDALPFMDYDDDTKRYYYSKDEVKDDGSSIVSLKEYKMTSPADMNDWTADSKLSLEFDGYPEVIALGVMVVVIKKKDKKSNV